MHHRYTGPSLADSGGMYVPSQVEILTTPKPGQFYQVKKSDSPWKVSRSAYGRKTVKAGLYWMNDSAWNGHIKKGKAGWEAYKIKGLQFNRKYDPNNPISRHGSGRAYPVVWLPPSDGVEPSPPIEDRTRPTPLPAHVCPPPRIVEKIVEVPGPERIVEKRVEVPGPTHILEKKVMVPGPERIVEVPGPPQIVEKIVEVPGPERIVEKIVEVPGPERIVEVPGPTHILEKKVMVPGPERIVEVPGPPQIIEKIVKVPGPERIVEKIIHVPAEPMKTYEKHWTPFQVFAVGCGAVGIMASVIRK